MKILQNFFVLIFCTDRTDIIMDKYVGFNIYFGKDRHFGRGRHKVRERASVQKGNLPKFELFFNIYDEIIN